MPRKTIKPFKLYGQDIDFIVNEGGLLNNEKELVDFLTDNLELLTLIYKYEDDLINVSEAAGLKSNDTVTNFIKHLFLKVGKEGGKFDEKKWKEEKDFYEKPIIEFKKLFD